MNQSHQPTPSSGIRVFNACLLSFLLITMPFVQLASAERRKTSDTPQRSEANEQTSNTNAAAENSFVDPSVPGPVVTALVPSLTATLTDTIVNDDADSKADPTNGVPATTEKIKYTAIIANAIAATDATSVQYSSTIDGHTTLIGPSLNASPLARKDSFTAIGNTLLEVGVTASGYPAVAVSGSVFDNDTEFLGDTFTLKSVQAVNFVGGNTTASTANGGTVTMEPDGNFSYLPPVDSTTTDSFTYTITDDGPDNSLNTPDDLTSTSTVTITFPVTTKVWWVDNTYAGANGASDGRSTRPYTSLTPLNGADLDDPGDVIYVHTGSGNYTAGITMEANQQLIGNGVALVVNSITLRGIGARPTVLVGAGDAVNVTDISGVVIRGLNLNGAVNAIDVTTTGANSGGVEIADNVITGAGQEGIDVNGGGSGTMTVSIHDNSVTAAGNGIDVRRTAGTVNVTAFDDNQVLGSTGGIGINVVGTGATVIFDSNTGTAAFDTVSGGTTAIGQSGNGVGLSGLVLDNIRGDISFTDLDIFADNGTALKIDSTSPNFNAGTSTGAQIVASGSNATLSAVNGPALDTNQTRINLVLSSLTSSGTGTAGVSLVETSGTFSAPSGSSISIIPTTAAFFVDGTSASGATVGITYAGTITSDTGRLVRIEDVTGTSTHVFSGLISDNQDAGGADGGESGISLSNNGGATISFTGGLNINTTTNTAFSATGGGTVTATQNNTSIVNTLSSVSNTALTVTSTNIGLSGLTFRSINAGNNTAAVEPVNGIVLSSTGTAAGNGGLTVTGDSGSTVNSSGGTIQATTGHGIALTSTRDVSLDQMNITNTLGDGINGSSVTNFNFTNSTISGAGDGANEYGIFITNLFGTNTINNVSSTNSQTNNLKISNNTNTAGTLTITNSTFTTTDAVNGGDCVNVETGVGGSQAGNLTVSLTDNNDLNTCQGDGIQAAGNDNSTLRITVDGSNSNYNGNLGSAVNVAGDGNAQIFVLVEDLSNVSTGTAGNNNGLNVINIQTIESVDNGPTLHATVRNNTITSIAAANPGQNAAGIRAILEGKGTLTANIHNNTISGNFSNRGIYGQSRAGNGILNLIINDNSINVTGAAPLNGITMETGSSAGGDTNTLRLNMPNNDSSSGAVAGYRLQQRTGTTFQLQDFGGNGAISADVSNWVTATKSNTAFGGGAATTSISIGTAFTATAGAVPTATLPLLFADGGVEAASDSPWAQRNLNSASSTLFNILSSTQHFALDSVPSMAANADSGIRYSLTQNDLAQVVDAAMSRWTASGLTAQQVAAMRTLKFELGDLARGYLGEASGNFVIVDSDAQGKGWFVDATPEDDVEFGSTSSATRRYTNPYTSAAGRIDLLTAIEHEIGHKLGLTDSYSEKDRDSIMYGYLTVGERRVPAKGQAANARAGSLTGSHFLSLNDGRKAGDRKQKAVSRKNHATATRAFTPAISGETVNVNIGTLKEGETVTINYEVTVNNPPDLNTLPNPLVVTPPAVATQGSVSYNDGATPQTPVLTDEVAGGAVTATETPVDLFDVDNVLASNLNPSNSGDNVMFTATITENPTQLTVNPTGTVDFIDTNNGNAVICDNVPLTVGLTAECQTSSLTSGTHNIRADYSGDGNFDAKQSNIEAQVVIACVTNPVVNSTADPGDGTCDGANCTLREAITNACSGSTITFDTLGAFSTPQSINLDIASPELSITRNMTIDAPDAPGNYVKVNGNGTRVFNIAPGKTVTMRDFTVANGEASGVFPANAGGGIYNDHSVLTLINMTVESNGGDGLGGGVYNNGQGGTATLTITGSTFRGNSVGLHGSAIYSDGSAAGTSIVVLNNSTISGNEADGQGGGIYVVGSSTSTLTTTNSTITLNIADFNDTSASDNGGGIFVGSGPVVTLRNTIVAGNVRGLAGQAPDDIQGSVDTSPASLNNLIGTGGSGGLTNANGNQVAVADAGLAALAPNGGLTQTHALLFNSPALEAGDNTTATNAGLTTDQRGTGYPRIADSADVNTTATVDIGAFELHPTIENIPDKTTAEDTAFNFNFNVGDDSVGLITSVTASSGNTTLVPNANLSVTDPPPANDGVYNLSITPDTNRNSPADGTAIITVTVMASNGQTAQDTFVLTVTEVNDNPDAVNDSLTAVDEDSGLRVIPFTDLLANDTNKGAANESGQTVNVTAVSNPVGGTVAINGTNVEFTVAANFSGTASFDYQITDNGTTNTVSDPKSDTATASFAVNSINDPPSFTIAGNPPAVNEDAGAQTVNSFATSISQGAGGETGQTLTFNITPTGTTGNLSFSSGPAINSTTGALTYTTNADTNGTATFDVTLSDNGSNVPPNSNTSGTQSFTITVNAVNDAPTFSLAGNPAAVNEDAGAQTVASFATNFQPGPVTATDEGTQTLVGYTVTSAGAPTGNLAFTSGPSIDNAGTLTYTPTANTNGTATFNAVATDSGSGTSPNVNQSAPIAFTITVNAVNDEPSFTAGPNQSVNISSGAQTVPGWATNISAGPADEVQTVAFTVNVTGTTGTLAFDVAPAVSPTGTLTYHATNGTSGTATVDVFLTDSGSGVSPNDNTSPTQTFTITVGLPTVSVHDAVVIEPSTGTANMVFTVTLNAPAPGVVTVDFTTANGSASSGTCGNPGADYVLTSGQVGFTTGQQVQTISVPVCADNSAEGDETLTVTLSSPVGATINDGNATGTIKSTNTAGTLLISEIRTIGPGGARDEFVEIYNNSDSPHTVDSADNTGYGVFVKGADCNATPVLVGVIPEGTVILARGHYLMTGPVAIYSLEDYGGTGAALGDLELTSDIPTDGNVGLFKTASITAISSVNRLDAIGFGANVLGNCDLLREGTPLIGVGALGSTEHSYFRKLCDFVNGVGCTTPGIPKDTNTNTADFMLADTAGTDFPGYGRHLGAPGPENLASPIRRDPAIQLLLLDSSVAATAVPNRFRDANANPGNSDFGTLSVRRRILNSTGGPVSRIRFRVVEITTLQSSGPGVADLRAITSPLSSFAVGPVGDSGTCGAEAPPGSPPCTVTVKGTTLETPPTQVNGGGLNSSITVTLGTPLANGQSVNVELLLGVMQTGTFRFLIIVEALP